MSFKDELNARLSGAFGDNVVGFRLTVMEGAGAVVEGYKGVSFVSTNEIKFRVSKTFLTITGENLEILDINGCEACIAGKVQKVEIATPA